MSIWVYLSVEVNVGKPKQFEVELFEANITGNLHPMWELAGIEDVIYSKDTRIALDMIPLLEAGLQKMIDNPKEFVTLNPKNGWGSYDDAKSWLQKLIDACREYPKATYRASW